MTQEIIKQNSVVSQLARKYAVTEESLLNTVKGTIMRPDKNGRTATNEEIIAFLLVASKYDLNPFTKEIYAFPDKRAGIIPIVGVDGFITLANRNDQFNGYDVLWSDEIIKNPEHKTCPSWCEVKVYRKDRDHPIIVREYFDEVYREPFKSDKGYVANGPWQTHTKRMLRHKTMNQAFRIAFGFVGIYDEDEAHRILEAESEVTTAISMKPEVKMPQAITNGIPKEETTVPVPQEEPAPTQKPAEVFKIEELAIQAFKSNKTAFLNWLGAEWGCEKIQELPENIRPKVIEALKKIVKEGSK